jgi:signal transduction histidine kinase
MNRGTEMVQTGFSKGNPLVAEIAAEARSRELLMKVGALQDAIFSSANFSIIATDERGVIQLFNPGAERMLGYAVADVVNKSTPADISDPREVIIRAETLSIELATTITPGFEALVFKASRGIEDIYELTYIRKDGSRLPALLSVTALRDDQGGIIGYLLIGTDNTAGKQVDVERQRLQETNVELESAKSAAEKANLAKSDFLSSMSHELRSPLNAILGFAQLMESATPAPTADQTESIGQILQAGWYLLELIDGILDLAAIESGMASPSMGAVSLSEILLECQTMMEPRARQFGVLMTFPQFDHPVYVWADRTRLKQIVINLLSNAIKYNKKQGTLVVDCCVSDAGRVRFCVRDTGEGLSPEKLAQLFQPFNRLGQDASDVVGSGIGLVVTKRLVELMDGTLDVSSTVGAGSAFCCELPAAEPPQPAPAYQDAAKPEATRVTPLRTMLYVEDNPANLMLVERLVARRTDVQLLSAINGTFGVELARVHQPQLILMDINLPGISGITALKRLREDPATAHIPVVALSANAMPHDIAKGLEVGFFRYLTPPR